MKFNTIALMFWGGLLYGQTIIAPVVEGGASLPVPPCVTGELYFYSGAAAGQNLYACANNTWTQINGSTTNGARTDTSNTFGTNTAQTFQGTLDASGATATLPVQTDAALPGTCSTGQLFLKTGSDPNRMLYVCSAANTWSQSAYAQGTSAQMPTSCLVGQMYFATDATPAGQNLYLCTATNIWTQLQASIGLSGSGTANQMAFFNSASEVISDSKVVRDSSGNLTLAGTLTTGPGSTNFGGSVSISSSVAVETAVNAGYRLYFGKVDSTTCTTGAATIANAYTHHRVNLNNQATCTFTWASGNTYGQLSNVIFCNGTTSATTTLTWPSNVKGGMAAGGTTGKCAAQSFAYDSTSSTWYATSPGSSWN